MVYTQYHTPDANMTSLIIRHDRTDEEVVRAQTSADSAADRAAARAPAMSEMHEVDECQSSILVSAPGAVLRICALRARQRLSCITCDEGRLALVR